MKHFDLARKLIDQVKSLSEIIVLTGLSIDEARALIRESSLTDVNKWWAGLHQPQRDFYLEDRWAMAAAALEFGKTGKWV